MTKAVDVPPGVDPAIPAPARMYDYFLGGTANFEADRAAADRVREMIPEVIDAAWANRGFHQRAARWIAQQGVRQFIDIGSGLPTVGNTHEVVQRVDAGARVVYVDHDPLVIAHASGLLTDPSAVRVVRGELREPASVLDHPDVRELIDFGRPAGLMMTAVVHFLAPEEDPWGLVARYLRALAPGSYLALSQVTDDKTPPLSVQVAKEIYARGTDNLYFRSQADIARFFAGLELVAPAGEEPGIMHAGEWGADDPVLADTDGSRWSYCGVGRVPPAGAPREPAAGNDREVR